MFKLLQFNDTMFYGIFDLLLYLVYYDPSYTYKRSFPRGHSINKDYSKGYRLDIYIYQLFSMEIVAF